MSANKFGGFDICSGFLSRIADEHRRGAKGLFLNPQPWRAGSRLVDAKSRVWQAAIAAGVTQGQEADRGGIISSFATARCW